MAVTSPGANSTVERVEVFHFHGNRQCASCIAVGDLAERTVNASFGTELASGRLVFAHVNYDLPENAALAAKFNVTGSSLWIGVYDANGFHKEQDTRVWSLISNEEAYRSYLRELISKRLNGDLS
ncbi:MAG: nitrophenyl compound nitroreductase subunit ArsF family protein [Methanoregula sp.]|nr:nitrophenyl compound nitroreductase subunit ArsF family protein [Methanoregula sp.]